ncbi:MAG: divalent-cation tolerance protein CutA [Bryobacteraceae bacterium]
MTDKIVVFSTCDSPEAAGRIARTLVETGVAACVNIIPGARSIYRWQGKIEESGELLLIVKSSRALLPRMMAELAKLHSYEIPEVIAVPIVDGSPAYLDWLTHELG